MVLQDVLTGLQISLDSKIFMLALSNMALSDFQDFTSQVFFKFGIRDPLNFDDGSKWSCEISSTGLQILVDCELSLLAPSKRLKMMPRNLNL